ncbi:MAG: GPR endopeptidase [Schaedlerella sp.]|nr:GPR endopeptidase [Schaedlerella sp.]
MLEKFSVRTDLALEEKEKFEGSNVEIPGVILEEEYDRESDLRITKVIIETEKGAKKMGKPTGVYLTLEADELGMKDENYHRIISEKLAEHIERLIKGKILKDREISILIAGLGNRSVTPDALGPYVVDNLCVTRHIVKEYGHYALEENERKYISAIAPGVMGQTGMETLEIIKGIVRETQPDLVIAVDALAARNCRRLNRTIQISDAGIHPGSGVGNHRSGLTQQTLGVPVLGIGVPTVVNAATIVNDTMENLLQALESSSAFQGVGNMLNTYSGTEKYELISELIAPQLNGMYVTLKEEDELIKQMSYTISEALNFLFLKKRRKKTEA